MRAPTSIDGLTAEQYGAALGTRCEYALGDGWLDISDAELAARHREHEERNRIAIAAARARARHEMAERRANQLTHTQTIEAIEFAAKIFRGNDFVRATVRR